MNLCYLQHLVVLFTVITHLVRNQSSLLICSFHLPAKYLIYIFLFPRWSVFILPYFLKPWHLCNQIRVNWFFLDGFVTCVSLYSQFLWPGFHFNLWTGQELVLLKFINSSLFETRKYAKGLSVACESDLHTLPWDLFLLPRGASLLRPSARRFSPCCSHCLRQTGSSRDLPGPEKDLKAGRSLPCEDMRYFGSLHFRFQRTEGRFLFSAH